MKRELGFGEPLSFCFKKKKKSPTKLGFRLLFAIPKVPSTVLGSQDSISTC